MYESKLDSATIAHSIRFHCDSIDSMERIHTSLSTTIVAHDCISYIKIPDQLKGNSVRFYMFLIYMDIDNSMIFEEFLSMHIFNMSIKFFELSF